MTEPVCPCPECSPRRRFRCHYRPGVLIVMPEFERAFMGYPAPQPPDPVSPPRPVRAKSFEQWIRKSAKRQPGGGRR